ncbi:MAG: type IV pilus twitching motility protein PilT [Candidatus Omnitrophota bacterium]
MQNNKFIQERRSAKRKIAKFSMRYKLIGGEDFSEHIATTVNVSSQSVLFEAEEAFPLGTKLEAELIVPSLSRPIQFKGSIKRTEEIASVTGKTRYLHAMAFENIAKEYQDALERFVQITDIDSILRMAVKKKASDIHLIAGQPPVLRVQGDLVPLDALPIPAQSLKKIIYSIMNDRQREAFEKDLELDLSYMISEGIRFRVNVHLEKGNLESAFRVIPANIKTVADLGLPPVVEELARKKRGLVIVTGPAGCGKSTTLAAMVDLINRERRCMVISIEDPIEYVHKSKESIIKQREVGTDTLSFANALKHALRQDPNVILVGEMRDLESISMAITAAETGHLVLATLHTSDTVECINRIIDVYPSYQQAQVASQLTACLEGIVSQLLLPRRDSKGRVVATEILVVTSAIRNLMRSKKFEQIYSYLESGGQFGMHTMDDSLLDLVKTGLIDLQQALGFAKNPTRFNLGQAER